MNSRKKQVLLEAQKLFLEKGVTNTSIQDILDRVKISKGTFYNYFQSKNECLLSIIELGREEADLRRREIITGKSITDKNVFCDQIVVLMQVNREQNIVPIFESIFHSGDSELKKHIIDLHIKEINWLAKRISDVYGKEIEPFAFDISVLLSGMLIYSANIWKIVKPEAIDLQKVIHFLISRIDDIVPNIITKNESIFRDSMASYIEQHFIKREFSKEAIYQQLLGFSSRLSEEDSAQGKEYVQYLIEEFEKAKPKYFIIEAVLRSFRQAFANTSHESEVSEITHLIWTYLEELRER